MSSYIFSFKRFFFIALLTFILATIGFDLLLHYYVERKTNKDSYIEEKVSKARHMKYNAGERPLDCIFIGNSRTMYHVSTEEFKKHGFLVYNYGVSDRTIIDFPYMVEQAIALKPRYIVINQTVSGMYTTPQGSMNSLTFEDLKYMKKYLSFDRYLKGMQSYLENTHLLFKHSESMNIRLTNLYNKLTIKREEKKKSLEDGKETTGRTKPVMSDCKIFDYNYPSKHKTVAKCTNGDGVLFGNYLKKENFSKRVQLVKLDSAYMQYLQDLVDTIKKSGSIPVVVLEPVYDYRYQYDLKEIRKKIHVAVIDLTNIHIDDSKWADNMHLNNTGRVEYSRILVKELKSIK